MSETLLGLMSDYGVIALFLALTVGSVGIPEPTSLMLLAAGSFVAQGEVELWPAFAASVAGSVFGDQIGYGLGHWGGQRLVDRITNRIGGATQVEKAEAFARRWGGTGVFLSRWLITPLGPCINVTSGMSDYAWPRFLAWCVAGKIIWVLLYGGLGYVFSDRVQAIAQLLGNLSGAIAGLVLTAALGYLLYRNLRPTPASQSASQPAFHPSAETA